jgi:ribose transport system permease protein
MGGILAGLATDLAVGMFNDWLTTKVVTPSFLTMLAIIRIAKEVAMWVSDLAAVPILSPNYS